MKKRLTVLLAAFLLLALTACSSAAIEDSNGPDDTSPAVITPGHTQFSLDGLKGDVSLRIAGESAAFSFSMLQSAYDSFVHP